MVSKRAIVTTSEIKSKYKDQANSLNEEGIMTFSIFLSHHETETELAQRFREFCKITSQKIEVHTFVQKAVARADYREWINKTVEECDMFMFLYTDETRELSWVAHELGLFYGMHKKQIKDERRYPPVECIKSQDIKTMPGIMSNIAPISATETNLQDLLQNLLANGKYSNNMRLANDTLKPGELQCKIDAEAKVLSGMFRSKILTQFFADRLICRNICAVPINKFEGEIFPDYQVERTVYNPEKKSDKKYVLDFSNVTIETNDHVKRNLRLPEECYWGDLVRIAEETKESGPSERFDLAKEIIFHASKDHFQYATSMMLAEIERDGKIFLPVISRVEKRDRLPISYFLLMLPDPRSINDKIIDSKELMEAFQADLKLVLLLRTARRFRWNVLEPFIWDILRAIKSSTDLRPIFHKLQSALAELEKESEQNKLDDGNLTALSFPGEHRSDLTNLYLRYAELRVDIDQAIKEDNPKWVLEILNEFQKMNRSFLDTALEVYKHAMIKIPTLDEAHNDWRNAFFGQSGCS